jgi:hypothetical protein
LGRTWGSLCAGLAVAIIVAPQAVRSIALDRLISRADTREMAVRSVPSMLAPDVRLGWIGTPYGCPRFALHPDALQKEVAKSVAAGRTGRIVQARLEVAEKRGDGIRLETIDVGCLGSQSNPPACILLEYYPIAWVKKATEGAEAALLAGGYSPVAEFGGASREQLDDPRMRYDPQDSFYVPFAGLAHVSRPGPLLTLWER